MSFLVGMSLSIRYPKLNVTAIAKNHIRVDTESHNSFTTTRLINQDTQPIDPDNMLF